MHVPVHATLQQKPLTQKPVPHVVPTLHAVPLAPPSAADSVGPSLPPSDAASLGPSEPLSVAPSAGESLVESPPPLLSPGVDVSPPLLESMGLVTSPEGESCSVVPSGPPSSGILLRSKSTSSSHPGITATATVAAAITRPHLIDFVLIGVLVVKAMGRLRTGP